MKKIELKVKCEDKTILAERETLFAKFKSEEKKN